MRPVASSPRTLRGHARYGTSVGAGAPSARPRRKRAEPQNVLIDSADHKEHARHQRFQMGMQQALVDNARERAIRFPSVHRNESNDRLMRAIRRRSFAFFEPRPEWNHTDNALIIVGRSQVFQGLYLDKRPFLNSYDYRQDPT
ncbi:MAG: putative inorganic carbon transporter subunit DabA, partial [Alphaproteobacteria bacterium]